LNESEDRRHKKVSYNLFLPKIFHTTIVKLTKLFLLSLPLNKQDENTCLDIIYLYIDTHRYSLRWCTTG